MSEIELMFTFAGIVGSVLIGGFWKMHSDIAAIGQEIQDLKEILPCIWKKKNCRR